MSHDGGSPYKMFRGHWLRRVMFPCYDQSDGCMMGYRKNIFNSFAERVGNCKSCFRNDVSGPIFCTVLSIFPTYSSHGEIRTTLQVLYIPRAVMDNFQSIGLLINTWHEVWGRQSHGWAENSVMITGTCRGTELCKHHRSVDCFCLQIAVTIPCAVCFQNYTHKVKQVTWHCDISSCDISCGWVEGNGGRSSFPPLS